jgi:hypothetical protein
MLFIPAVNVDRIWKIIAGATIAGDLGISAKVAPHDKDEDPQSRRARLICIYTKDFSDIEDVVRVRRELKKLGMVETREKIYYKPSKLMSICLCDGAGTKKLVSGILTRRKTDAYTYLDIKAGNPYGIKPWIYRSSDAVIPAKEHAEGKTLDEWAAYKEENKKLKRELHKWSL